MALFEGFPAFGAGGAMLAAVDASIVVIGCILRHWDLFIYE
jgi:hypothetical protein